METFDMLSEGALRLTAFLGIFVAMAVLELARPRRAQRTGKVRRWATNLLIAGLDSLVVRLLALLAVPVAAVAAASWAEAQGWGILNAIALPVWLDIAIAVIVLDLAIYGQHVASHAWPPLWRLHQMHHADIDFDVTTAVRFHPIEIALSMLWKIVVVLALGASPWAVVLFEILLNGCAMFNHANLALPKWLDVPLRMVLVTPDMHRVHHSIHRDEHDTNYGFCLSCWDRLFGTYTDQPREGHLDMTIGLTAYQNDDPTRLGWSLWLPFARSRRKDQKKLSGK